MRKRRASDCLTSDTNCMDASLQVSFTELAIPRNLLFVSIATNSNLIRIHKTNLAVTIVVLSHLDFSPVKNFV